MIHCENFEGIKENRQNDLHFSESYDKCNALVRKRITAVAL